MVFQNAKLAALEGITKERPDLPRRSSQGPDLANGANGPRRLSTTLAPCGGMNAVARIISRTLAAPSLATTPGTISPPIEWPTTTTSPNEASATSSTTEATQAPIVVAAGRPRRPGKSTASTRKHGSWQANSAITKSQQSPACAPPWTKTRSGSVTSNAFLQTILAADRRYSRGWMIRP